MAVELGRGRRRSLYSSSGARRVKVGGFKGEVNSRCKLKEANSRSRRAHIHGSKSAVATKIRGRLEYSRSPKDDATPAHRARDCESWFWKECY
jgi:hypothetical protein